MSSPGSQPPVTLRHVDAELPSTFELDRNDGSRTVRVTLPAAEGFRVAERITGDLLSEARWYYESFLAHPQPPATLRAERFLRTLDVWGAHVGTALGSIPKPAGLCIESADPRLLAWPWEAVRASGETEPIGLSRRVERWVPCGGVAAEPGMIELPTVEVLEVLLVIARPAAGADLPYQTVARPLLDQLASSPFQICLHLLRPPTLAALAHHLAANRGRYQLLQFDGHGTLWAGPRGVEGHLVFESPSGGVDRVAASTLASLLREQPVPIVVLHACRSAWPAQSSSNAFNSAATALLAGGCQTVVAMAFSLQERAAQIFVPAFYGGLSAGVAAAVLRGRQALAADLARPTSHGSVELADWMVPTIYRDHGGARGLRLAVVPRGEPVRKPSRSPRLIDRDTAFLHLDRVLAGSGAGALLRGFRGGGKTALVQAWLEWLAETDSAARAIWIDVRESPQASMVLERSNQALAGGRGGLEIVIWDHVELLTTAMVARNDRESLTRLHDWVRTFCGRSRKIIALSRKDEPWLADALAPLWLTGLDSPSTILWGAHVLCSSGIQLTTAQREDEPGWQLLMHLLAGHPGAIATIFPLLTPERSVSELAQGLQLGFGLLWPPTAFDPDPSLMQVIEKLPHETTPLLPLLALHHQILVVGFLKEIAKDVLGFPVGPAIDALIATLAAHGVARIVNDETIELHPLLTAHLRAHVAEITSQERYTEWARAFVKTMGTFACFLFMRPYQEFPITWARAQGNFLHALHLAGALGLHDDWTALSHWFNLTSLQLGNVDQAALGFAKVADELRNTHPGPSAEDRANESVMYHHLGQIMHQKRDFAAAERWFRRSLALDEEAGDSPGIFAAHHHLGRLAQERGELGEAREHFTVALTHARDTGAETAIAGITLHLGIVAQEERDFATARELYQKALAAATSAANADVEARAHHQLGNLAFLENRLDDALKEAIAALRVKRREAHDEPAAATTLHQLGLIEQARGELATAEQWFLDALDIAERHGLPFVAAGTCHHLGEIAQQRSDLDSAEAWFRKELNITESIDDPWDTLDTLDHLGSIAQARGDLETAATLHRRVLESAEAEQKTSWVARGWYQLGRIAEQRGDRTESEAAYAKAIEGWSATGEHATAALVWHRLAQLAHLVDDLDAAAQRYEQSLALSDETADGWTLKAVNAFQLGGIMLAREQHEHAFSWFLEAAKAADVVGDQALESESLEQVTALLEAVPAHHRRAWLDQLEQFRSR